MYDTKYHGDAQHKPRVRLPPLNDNDDDADEDVDASDDQ